MILASFSLYGKDGDSYITKSTIDKTISELTKMYGENNRIERGVLHTSKIWFEENGSQEDFVNFAIKYFVNDEDSLYNLAVDLSNRFQMIDGYAWKANREFEYPINVDTGEITPVQDLFSRYSFNADIKGGYYRSKIAFLVTLNFPSYTDEEKTQLGGEWSSIEWGYAQLGDMFKRGCNNSKKNPADTSKMEVIQGDSQLYANNSTVELASICNKKGEKLFDDDIQLLFHWKMRDEIKMLYDSKDSRKLEKQQAIYQAMTRFIDQTIPAQLMQGKGYQWNPYTNELKKNGRIIEAQSAENKRYGYIRNLFIRKYNIQPDSAKYFNEYFGNYGVTPEEVEAMYIKILSSPQAKEIGKIIRKKIGRKLQPFDVWYTGFNNRSNYEASVLDDKIKAMYPSPKALQDAIPSILVKLGFPEDKAQYYGERIQIDKARANGHSMGANLKGEKAHIRTNFRPDGLDFGGYQTAMHELGHSVQQTIATYKIDLYSLRGLPNSGIVESAAMLFEFRTWNTLLSKVDPVVQNNLVLDNFWSAYEIIGPALCELRAWQWMYHKKDFTIEELKEKFLLIAKDIWNEFYAPVFGCKNHIMSAVYNHTLNASLYLSGYALAHMIQIQIEDYIDGKDFCAEVERIYGQGNMKAEEWMKRAVGTPVSADPILRFTEKALQNLKDLK